MNRQVSLPTIGAPTAVSSRTGGYDDQKLMYAAPPELPLSHRDEIIRSADLGKSKSNIRAQQEILQQQIHRGQTPIGSSN
jgi:hypothetical protein